MLRSLRIISIVGTLSALPAQAEEASAREGFTPSVIAVRQHVQSDLQWLANSADWLLGGNRAVDVRNEGTLRLEARALAREHERPTHSFHLQLVTKLETLERWKNDIQKWEEKKIDQLKSKAQSSVAGIQENLEAQKLPFASPASLLRKEEARTAWRFSLDKKLKFEHPKTLDADLRLRARRESERGKWLMSLATDLNWTASRTWGANFSADFYRHLDTAWVLNLGNSLHYDFSEESAETSHGPTLTKIISPTQAMAFGASLQTTVSKAEPRGQISSYAIPLTYRAEFTRTGLFLAAASSLVFPRERQFRGELAMQLSVAQVF